MRTIISILLFLIGLSFAITMSNDIVVSLFGYVVMICVIFFGFKKEKKIEMLICPKTGLAEIDPNSHTYCVECSMEFYNNQREVMK